MGARGASPLGIRGRTFAGGDRHRWAREKNRLGGVPEIFSHLCLLRAGKGRVHAYYTCVERSFRSEWSVLARRLFGVVFLLLNTVYRKVSLHVVE